MTDNSITKTYNADEVQIRVKKDMWLTMYYKSSAGMIIVQYVCTCLKMSKQRKYNIQINLLTCCYLINIIIFHDFIVFQNPIDLTTLLSINQ